VKWTRKFALRALGGLIPYVADLYYVRYEKIRFILQHLEFLAAPAAIVAGMPFRKAVRLRDKAVEAGIQSEPWIVQHKK